MNFFSAMFSKFLIAAGVIWLVSAPAHAFIIDNGGSTLDTSTGLEWLDLTASTNRSYNDVASQFGAGGDFEGLRHATLVEVRHFFVELGFPIGSSSTPSSTGMLQAIQLLGETNDANTSGLFDPTDRVAAGWVDLYVDNPLVGLSFAYLSQMSSTDSDVAGEFTVARAFAGATLSQRGHFLVRSTISVAEPGILALFGLGLISIGFAKRKKQTA